MASPRPSSSLLRFGVFELDTATWELRKSGSLVKLQPEPFKVLWLLASHAGQLVTREEICKKLWGDETFVDFEHGLNTCIAQIRDVLGDDAKSPHFIETLPRRGYRFVATVTQGDSPAIPQGIEEPPSPLPLRNGWRDLIGLLSLLVAIGAASYFVWQRYFSAQALGGKVMLAVLPFENLSGDPNQEYFSDGLTEEMITQLGRLQPERLGVIARTSTMQYKKSGKDIKQIARELKVDFILEGSVRREGERVRVAAQLIQARDGTHIWAETYERELREILALHSEVALAVAAEVRAKLTPDERARLASARAVNPEAYEAYVKGRYWWNKRGRENLLKALQYFQQAIEKDPTYAPGYAGLAGTYDILGDNGYWQPGESFPKARTAAQKALELDESLSQAHLTLAAVMWNYDRDWSGAERECRRALALDPNYGFAHQTYAYFLSARGRHAEAIAEVRLSRQLDPLAPRISANVGWILYYAREYDQALEALNRALELEPDHAQAHEYLGQVYLQKGRYVEAIAAFKRASEMEPQNQEFMSNLARAYAVAGNRAAARKLLGELQQASKRIYVSPISFAQVHLGLGEKDQVFAWLEKAFTERTGQLLNMTIDPGSDPLRADPRFQDLLQRMNFPRN